MALRQLLVRQWYVVCHHIRRVHLGTVVRDLGGRRTTLAHHTQTDTPGWLLQFRMPGPAIVVTHTAQHPHQQQLSPGGVCGALLDECVRAVSVGSAFSKVRAASVLPRLGRHQAPGTHKMYDATTTVHWHPSGQRHQRTPVLAVR